MNVFLAEQLFSAERFAPYRVAAGRDPALAIELYRWNVEVSVAFFELLAFIEVAVRNACDAALTSSQPHQVGVPWYLDRVVLSPQAIAIVETVRDRIHQQHGSESPGRVVAGLPFGFWRGLLDRKNEQLWIARLHAAFPSGDGKRRSISEPLSALHPFRNRLAHHEPILDMPDRALDRRREEVSIVARSISSEFDT